ncbi:MAG: nickel-dependent hydrogenase large subunit [Denitrovibrio sp.]|nr:MAG: nickel-dependent hydrogenase large subunit [Denitrovibrio sp.]
MAKTISIEPITRIEGHMKVETHIENGKVSNAQISGQMYRGFEKFLEGRHPVDAARIAQRVCGVCHEVHGIASILALEELYNNPSVPNGHILRDLILGMHLITDHLLHFYTLCMPDYVDFTKILEYNGNDTSINNLKNWVIKTKPQFVLKRNSGNYISDTNTCLGMINNYFQALKLRSRGATGMALIGAKAPFAHAVLPGGITTDITPATLMQYHTVLEELKGFVINQYIPDVMEVAKRYPEYFDIGVSYNNFYTNETFKSLGDPVFKGGIILDGNDQSFDFNHVKEYYDTSYYTPAGEPDPKKDGAYSWTKSPRYNGEPVEVGPLARMIVNKDPYFFKTMKKLGGKVQSSTMGRHVARAVESRNLLDHLYSLLDSYKLGESNIREVDFAQKITGKGTGFSIAARGALIHQIEAVDGKITKYNMIVPSTWNFGPMAQGKMGVVEKSLVNTPVKYSTENSIEVGRVIRSYDPCTACSIH